ncbi:MAG: S9 family peptidase [Thaumarchaeota archaeon]|nr:S9 family peptidase [Nitrososphaerota archaeon]
MNPEPLIASYGSWKSPITAELFATSFLAVNEPAIEGGRIYWKESRPKEGGRSVIVRQGDGGAIVEITPKEFNVRTTVHEYGGGDYIVHAGKIYFSNFKDQRLYLQDADSPPTPITPPEVDLRYSDGVFDAKRNRLILVREDHRVSGSQAANTIVSVDPTAGGPGEILVSGNDFYSNPRLNPDDSHLAWLAWNHPNMPWDGTELWVGKLGPDGTILEKEMVAGGPEESIFQPEWSPEGNLYFVSDRTGWWNIYRWRDGKVEGVHPTEGEFGQPQWLFRERTFAFESPRSIICSHVVRGTSHLGRLNTETGELQEIPLPYTDYFGVLTWPGNALLVVGSPAVPLSIVKLDLKTLETNVLRRSRPEIVDPGYLSSPETIQFPTEQGKTAFAFYYPPRNKDYRAPTGERPPLLVMSHGGPTSAAGTTLRYGIQFWTSHGIAVVDVDYGGSTGYGREYRRRLEGNWGVVDVDDCVNAARFLVNRQNVDGHRLAIMGGSAGGYTTLSALAFRNFFNAGASYFGVSDLEALAKDTHKFESSYEHKLVGPYPERQDLYRQRSPIHFTDKVSCPIILFQGLEDKVVPPDQSAKFYESVKNKGLPTAYISFEGEQHGFRRGENMKRAMELELYFYSRIFGFEPAEQIEPVRIDNLQEN